MKLIECPRDAIQGIKKFIPTKLKAEYLNVLLGAGFDTIDFGSFVSPKVVPQMADTAEVLRLLKPCPTKLLAIIANERGARDALQFRQIDFLGYPFSISETFQLRNTGVGIAESLERVKSIQELCLQHGKELVIYISMAFGNPYGDEWNAEIALQWIEALSRCGVRIFSLADTIGIARPESIVYLFSALIPAYSQAEFGAHFHTRPDQWLEKLEAGWQAGCRRFDGAIAGYGGCPMAQDELVGNMATENLVRFLAAKGIKTIAPDTVMQLKQAFEKLLTDSSS